METATYGYKLVAGRVAVDYIVAFRYDLRMLGVEVTGPSILFIDNLSMITSVSLPKSSLKKKHNSLASHRCREAVAAGILSFLHCRLFLNCSDCLTKLLPSI